MDSASANPFLVPLHYTSRPTTLPLYKVEFQVIPCHLCQPRLRHHRPTSHQLYGIRSTQHQRLSDPLMIETNHQHANHRHLKSSAALLRYNQFFYNQQHIIILACQSKIEYTNVDPSLNLKNNNLPFFIQ